MNRKLLFLVFWLVGCGSTREPSTGVPLNVQGVKQSFQWNRNPVGLLLSQRNGAPVPCTTVLLPRGYLLVSSICILNDEGTGPAQPAQIAAHFKNPDDELTTEVKVDAIQEYNFDSKRSWSVLSIENRKAVSERFGFLEIETGVPPVSALASDLEVDWIRVNPQESGLSENTWVSQKGYLETKGAVRAVENALNSALSTYRSQALALNPTATEDQLKAAFQYDKNFSDGVTKAFQSTPMVLMGSFDFRNGWAGSPCLRNGKVIGMVIKPDSGSATSPSSRRAVVQWFPGTGFTNSGSE